MHLIVDFLHSTNINRIKTTSIIDEQILVDDDDDEDDEDEDAVDVDADGGITCDEKNDHI